VFEVFAAYREILHVGEWTGLSVGMLAGLGALAWFFPPARTLAISTGIAVVVGYGCLIYGNHTGRDDVLAEWTAANARAKAATAAADTDAQSALDAKYLPVIAALQKRADDLKSQANGDDSKIVGAMAGACQLGTAPLRLRKPAK
jgi:hypothetical protein